MQAENHNADDLLDRMAIRSTLEAYFSAVDRRDWAAYGQCFAEDARVAFTHGAAQHVVGREAILQRAAGRVGRPASNHLLSNTHIVVAGDRATATTHAIAHLVVSRPDGERLVVRGIVYNDELARTGEVRWEIVQRAHEPLWQFESPALPLGY